ncbi:ATP synthase subunit s, mitochondrial [Galendromus occidentalis]|uniref:ATP synthase subunit s, mitochondrial n=1 Tax=Galendromus occidentalis TaxID=34638 RepID=A0AAJ7L5S1_9ACAR|nr:ATP synthase subunit s, mitochondrial [Galendromus occidentalis]
MQHQRRILTSLVAIHNPTRMTHTNPLGPSRGKPAPPWAVEKLLMEGHTRDQIMSDWEALVRKPHSSFDRIDRFLRALRRDYDLSYSGIKEMFAQKRLARFREDQNYHPLADGGTGPDIAAAKFLMLRSAAVKFRNIDDWMTGEDKALTLPTKYHPGFIIEAIDLRDFQILHRGFEHFARCGDLKSLKMVKQKYVDDFCLDSVSGMFNLSLQYLDVSGCELVTEKGLACLHRCKNLKLLNAYNLPGVKHPELLAILLEESSPALEIRADVVRYKTRSRTEVRVTSPDGFIVRRWT